MDRKLLLLATLLLLPPATRAAGDAALDRATLRGITSVGVVIDNIDPEIEKLGVTRNLLLPLISQRLEQNHINMDKAANEFLGLRITGVRNTRGPWAVALSVGLYQPVLLSRNHDIHTSTQTWEVESVLMADPKGLADACSETAGDLVNHFAQIFKTVNPQ